MAEKNKKLMIVDGNSLVHRGFHAIPHLSTSKGEPSNGVYGFVMIFLNAVKKIQPDYVAVTFDLSGPTFRDKLYKEYKATRVAAPQELYDQIPRVKEFVRALNLPVFEKSGFEADDVIGTIVKHDKPDIENVIVTGDLDSLQLVDEHTRVLTTKKGLSEITEYDETAVKMRYGFGPEYVADFKALRGDPSDNIPGVHGIGEKGAIELIKKFGHVEEMYAALEKDTKSNHELSAKIREKLIEHKADCLLSKKLAVIETHVPIKFDLAATRFGSYDSQRAMAFLQAMEFKSLLDKLPRPADAQAEKAGKTVGGPGRVISKNYHLVDTQEKLDELAENLVGRPVLCWIPKRPRKKKWKPSFWACP